jgi:hypothetical protein
MRPLTLDDVRFDSFTYHVTAAPIWAYAKDRYGILEPIAEAWEGVLKELQALAKANDQAHLQWRLELGRAVAEGRASDGEKQAFDMFGRSLPPPTILRPLWSTKHLCFCRVCFQHFYAARPAKSGTTSCSARCLREVARLRSRRRRSRAKPKAARPCQQCGATYTPTRSDACFCSTRCRVAHHRSVTAER